MLTKPVHFYGPDRKGAPQSLIDLEKKIRDADCYVVVSAEYNHSIPPGQSQRKCTLKHSEKGEVVSSLYSFIQYARPLSEQHFLLQAKWNCLLFSRYYS